ncbi:helix-turn-helix domain-containing protein [Kushneria konosiri]|uniref:HTH araC/xylS-type domain-containing protein n=1 Tax=Kushneria konosiri TaxID=698828 RepID=A0A2Z2H4Q3_9GAMM|nr:helix-turn-helix domain-containing protein [Kushneria konosiri]ARS52234.1 hypothetical protein B9G99_04520 [Kushneria konosiri]
MTISIDRFRSVRQPFEGPPLRHRYPRSASCSRRFAPTITLVTAIAGQVGYESPSQFSREYRRLFGDSPRGDRRRWLEQNAGTDAVTR